MPNNDIIEEVLLNINNELRRGLYSFQSKTDNYSIDISEGDEVIVSIPKKVIDKKLKDKLDEETKQFDENVCNFVVIDVTPVILGLDDLSGMVRNYFDYSCNSVIWVVFLVSKKWVIEKFSSAFRMEILSQPNLKGRNKDLAAKIVSDLFPPTQS